MSPPLGRGDESLDGEASPTRCEALERFGIDLGRVGAMTTARTNSRQSLAAPPTEESPRTERSRRARQEGGSKNSNSNNSDGIQTEEGRSRKRNRGGAFATTVTASKDSESSSAAADKLREINMLLAASEQPLVPPAAMNCVPSKQERNSNNNNIDPDKKMPKTLLRAAGSFEGAIAGCGQGSPRVTHDDAAMDIISRRDVSPRVSPRQNHQIPAGNSGRRDDLPRLRKTQGVGAKDDVATVDVQQEPQRAGSDRERAPEERAQTEAPVIPTLNIDGRGSTETLPPKEDTTLKPDAKGLPNHRQVPCGVRSIACSSKVETNQNSWNFFA